MSTPTQWTISFVVVSFFAACSSDPDPLPDAATDGDADADADFEVALPVLTPCPDGWEEVPPEEEGGVTTCDPWPGSSPVVMTPCPEGWREVEDDGVVTCDPWPEGGPHECAEDEAHFPGEPGCSRIGTVCPEGNWAEDLPEDGTVLYVLAGAPAGGEGTQESPFGSIRETQYVAEQGTIVALSKGTFDEAVRLRIGVTLWGACVAETVVTCSTPSSDTGTVSVGGRDTVIRNLQIGGNRMGVTVMGSLSLSLRIEDVLITRSEAFGVVVSNARATGRSVVIRGTRSNGVGLFGRGIEVNQEAVFELQRAVLERNRDNGVYVSGIGTVVSLSDMAVRDTSGRESDRAFGRGLGVEDGAQVEVSRAVFERNRDLGIGAVSPGTVVRLTDVVVRDTRSLETENAWGYGLHAGEAARVVMNRAVFERNRDHGVFAFGSDTMLDMTGLVVRDTQSREFDGRWGRGLCVQEGARAIVSGAVFDRNRDVAVAVIFADSALVLSEALVRDTLGRESDGMFGRGLNAQKGAHVEVSRTLFERNRDVGVIAASEGTTLRLDDVVVRDTGSQESGGHQGRGLSSQDGARVDVARALFNRNREINVHAFGQDSAISMTDTAVESTYPADCAASGDCMGFGDGIGAAGGGSISLSLFEISRNARCGVTVHDATMDLHDGRLSSLWKHYEGHSHPLDL